MADHGANKTLSFWRTPVKSCTTLHKVFLLLLTLSLCSFSIAQTIISKEIEDPYYNDAFNAIMAPAQYQKQAEALLDGHAWLDIDVPDWLARAENPYDYAFRHDTSAATGQPYYFDYAFHDGKYYCYDGILPVLTLFLPYKAVTGTDMSNQFAMSVLTAFAVASTAALALMVALRYDRWTTIRDATLYIVGTYLLSGITYLAYRPTVYTEAIAMSYVCATAGIAFWLYADDVPDNEYVRKAPLVLGSTAVGCTLLARPLSFLCVMLAFPIFWHRFHGLRHDERQFFGLAREAVVNTSIVVLPMLLLGCICMWWNTVRFGSPLDFGYTYNLTGFDMTTHGTSKKRLILGLIMYFLAPLNLKSTFPYMVSWGAEPRAFTDIIESIPTMTIIEPYYGGLLAFCPFVAMGLRLFGSDVDRSNSEGTCWLGLVWFSLLVAISIALFDSNTAITQRYQSDFFWLVGIAWVTACSMTSKSIRGSREKWHLFQGLITVLLVVAILIMLINLCAADRYSPLTIAQPDLWNALKNTLP